VRSVIESAREAVSRAPDSAATWGRLGKVLAAHGFNEQAVRCFTEAERLDPHELRWPYYRGAFLPQGDPEAIPPLRRAVALCGDERAPRLRLAEALLGQGHSREAEELFPPLLAPAPGNPHAHVGLGRVAVERSDWSSALSHLGHAATSPLTQKQAHSLLAEVHRRREDPSAAQRERRLADDLLPDPEMRDDLLEEVGRL